MHVIKTYYPNYKGLEIHETSPGNRGTSPKLKRECSEYSVSYYYPDLEPGIVHPMQGFGNQNLEAMTFEDGSFDLLIQGFCNQNLEAMTFEDESFDLFISQDVMEHVFNPAKAFSEIARVLKPGGAHIFSVPLINKEKKSECWASQGESGEFIYHHEPEYHGNPIDNKGSLVTMHWGYDLAEFIQKEAGTPTTIVTIDNIALGIRAEYIEILISRKY